MGLSVCAGAQCPQHVTKARWQSRGHAPQGWFLQGTGHDGWELLLRGCRSLDGFKQQELTLSRPRGWSWRCRGAGLRPQCPQPPGAASPLPLPASRGCSHVSHPSRAVPCVASHQDASRQVSGPPQRPRLTLTTCKDPASLEVTFLGPRDRVSAHLLGGRHTPRCSSAPLPVWPVAPAVGQRAYRYPSCSSLNSTLADGFEGMSDD